MLLKWGIIGEFQKQKSGLDAPKVGNHRFDNTLIGIFREDAPKVGTIELIIHSLESQATLNRHM